MTKKKVKYAKESKLDSDEFDPKYVKVQISIRLDGDVLDAIKRDSDKRKTKYQSLINRVLRDHFLGDAEEERIRQIVREELSKAS